ncbi:transcription factor bHLH25-like isoform X2 [Prosopis cineraria]|uniref:transcription factor bHLH25-like isoform X2 n=1 Tax=Prosopis cineraria TaxID=364024 RepID=UPI00240F10D3|nr:transcription factor bHLH25-like isoform X2 [Prosopis cineraria]
MESSFWETCLPYLEIGDDEQLVCHQSDQQQSFPVFCHQPSTSVQNLHDLITFSPITFNNLVSFDDYDVGSVPSTVQKACTKQESGRDSVNQFGSRISRNRGTRKGRNSKTGTLDHVIAERNRRHELAEKFLALSATIPGLKKMRDEYGMTVDDLVKNLRRDLFKLREDAWA